MLLSELKQRRNVVLLDNATIQFVLYPSNKEEIMRAEELLSLGIMPCDDNGVITDFDFLKDINMCGHINEVHDLHCKEVIPLVKIHEDREYGERGYKNITYIQEHKCYQEYMTPAANNNVIKHEDKLSSFKCACQKLQTNYFILIKQDKITDIVITEELVKEVLREVIKEGEGIWPHIEEATTSTLTEEGIIDLIEKTDGNNSES